MGTDVDRESLKCEEFVKFCMLWCQVVLHVECWGKPWVVTGCLKKKAPGGTNALLFLCIV